MTIRRRVQPEELDSPAQLAAEHDRALQEYNARRANVLDRGAKRHEQLGRLAAEVAAEQKALREFLDGVPAV